MDATAQYRQLALMGRAAFLASAAPAALLRKRDGSSMTNYDGFDATGTFDDPISEVMRDDDPKEGDVDVLPLIKKPGAQFGDRITVGRTANNDIVLAHHTVSRLHVYFRQRGDRWFVTDTGSKNGTAIGEVELVARKETALVDGNRLWIGDIEVVFHTAASLYAVLGGR